MLNRRTRARLAAETLEILEEGAYTASDGRHVDIAAAVQACLDGTCFLEPEALATIREEVLAEPPTNEVTNFEVANETTLIGAYRLIQAGSWARVGVLNFASAKNPGGGFQGGSQAQEESLARSSALYPSLLQARDYYEFHRENRSCFYSDRMIYSPRCPVLRDDEGTLLAVPYEVDFITSPAPNAGVIRRNEPESVDRIPGVLEDRSGKFLALAAHVGCDVLVLGAWGCGVFKNDPVMVAEAFGANLGPGGPFHGRFAHVIFSVFDRSKTGATHAAFHARFGAAP